MPMTPEQKARGEIDWQLNGCGWVVQDVQYANIHAARGVAIKECPPQSGRGFADYTFLHRRQGCGRD